MREPPPPATCARCGAWNPPGAATCSACGTHLVGPLRRPPHDASRDRTARRVGLALIVGSALVIAVLLPSVLAGVGRAPAPTAVAIFATNSPTATPTTAPTRSLTPVASPARSMLDPGADADNTIGGGSADATPRPAATPAPDAPGTVALPSLTVDIAGATRISYFGISGRAPTDLVRSMERNAADHCETREALACVALRPDINPTYRITSTGSCVLTGATTSLKATVYVPRWIKPSRVYPELLAWWREVLDHIAWHEGRHIRIEKAWLKKAPGMLEGKACASAQRVLERWATKVAEAQAAFDAEDYVSYQYPPYSGPAGT